MEKKVVLITGASSGIGLEVARQLMNKGCCVYACSRRGGMAEKSEAGIGEIRPLKVDVNNDASIENAIQLVLAEMGKLDAVICNAGNGIAGAVEDCSEEEVRFQMETNFFGAVRTIQKCLPVFREQGYGKIMLTSSVAAIVPIPYQAFYSAGKAAASIFMQALSMEVKPYGIQCCTVLPGDTKTDFTASRKYANKSQTDDSVYAERMKKSIAKMEHDEKNGMEAAFVARKMVTQILQKKMKPIIIPGFQYKLICGIFIIIPVKLRLWIVSKLY